MFHNFVMNTVNEEDMNIIKNQACSLVICFRVHVSPPTWYDIGKTSVYIEVKVAYTLYILQ